MPQKRILVVDDDAGIADFLSSFLTQKGFAVEAVYSGVEAEKIAQDWRPHLVLLDIMMPIQDGYTTLEALIKENDKLPVLMITSLDDIESGKKALELGAADYITKPLDLEYLEHSVLGKLGVFLAEVD